MTNLKVTKDELIEKIKKYFETEDIQYTITNPEGDPVTKATVIIHGHHPFILNMQNTDKGLSAWAQGKGQKIGTEILAAVTSDISEVEMKKISFNGITNAVYNSIKTYYENCENFSVTENEPKFTQKNLYISHDKEKIVIEWYHTTHRMQMTGNTTYLWDDVYLELTSHLNLSVREIVTKSINNLRDLQDVSINYDDGILDAYLISKLTQGVYDDELILTKFEKNWLKTSAFMIYTEIKLPEYFAAVSSGIKVIEGVLKRIFVQFGIAYTKDLTYFDHNEERTVFTLKDEYRSIFGNNDSYILVINDLYTFIAARRHKLFHNDGAGIPEVIATKQEAVEIFQKIINLLKSVAISHII